MVINNAFDDNVKFVFDLTNVAPITRLGVNFRVVDEHLRAAEENKRHSPAWKDFAPNDGMVSEFIPLALG